MHIFDELEDATQRLTNHSQNFQIPIRENLQNPDDIIRFSVGQNIFRALRLDNHRPSEVYRTWATENFESLHTELANCQNQVEFDTIIESFTDSFLIRWSARTNQKLVYGPASKIVNLLVKSIQESNHYRISPIFQFQHVPWDSYTLRPLRNIINSLTNVNCSINIPTTAAMSFVNTKELYIVLQKAIFELYSRLEGQPSAINYDYFAWNDNH